MTRNDIGITYTFVLDLGKNTRAQLLCCVAGLFTLQPPLPAPVYFKEEIVFFNPTFTFCARPRSCCVGSSRALIRASSPAQ